MVEINDFVEAFSRLKPVDDELTAESFADFLRELGYNPDVDELALRLKAANDGNESLGVRGFVSLFKTGNLASRAIDQKLIHSSLNLIIHAGGAKGGIAEACKKPPPIALSTSASELATALKRSSVGVFSDDEIKDFVRTGLAATKAFTSSSSSGSSPSPTLNTRRLGATSPTPGGGGGERDSSSPPPARTRDIDPFLSRQDVLITSLAANLCSLSNSYASQSDAASTLSAARAGSPIPGASSSIAFGHQGQQGSKLAPSSAMGQSSALSLSRSNSPGPRLQSLHANTLKPSALNTALSSSSAVSSHGPGSSSNSSTSSTSTSHAFASKSPQALPGASAAPTPSSASLASRTLARPQAPARGASLSVLPSPRGASGARGSINLGTSSSLPMSSVSSTSTLTSTSASASGASLGNALPGASSSSTRNKPTAPPGTPSSSSSSSPSHSFSMSATPLQQQQQARASIQAAERGGSASLTNLMRASGVSQNSVLMTANYGPRVSSSSSAVTNSSSISRSSSTSTSNATANTGINNPSTGAPGAGSKGGLLSGSRGSFNSGGARGSITRLNGPELPSAASSVHFSARGPGS